MRNKHSCSEPDCDRPAFGRGLCSVHYQRARYHGTLPIFPEKACAHCGTTFTDRKWNSVFCSRGCLDKARYQVVRDSRERATACAQCGTPLDMSKRTDARFCSERCGTDFHNAEMAVARRANKPRCVHCGSAIPLHAKRFCSRRCSIAHRRPEKYGMTRDELAAFLEQHGVCAICKTDQWGRRGPQVDHDHATGRVRGVLCSNCNQALGRFADDPARIQAAADYLT